MIFEKIVISLAIFYLIFMTIEYYDKRPWITKRKSGEMKIGEIICDLIDENGIIVKTGKKIYSVYGHFSKSSKLTAKDKVERLIKTEVDKNQ